MKTYFQFLLVLISLGVVFTLVAKESAALTQAAAAEARSEIVSEELANRSRYPVTPGGCDCHTPKVMIPLPSVSAAR